VNILVVGGAGFLGSQLVDRLLSEDHAVDVVDDLSTGSLTNLADARSSGGALKFHHLDAGSPEADSLIGMRTPEVIFLLTPMPAAAAPASAHARCFEIALWRRWKPPADTASRRWSWPFPRRACTATPPPGRCRSRKAEPSANSSPRGVRGVVARAIVELLVTYRDQSTPSSSPRSP
jgi:UDP-glucose 4-epimerase